jgi:hypothetical protein
MPPRLSDGTKVRRGTLAFFIVSFVVMGVTTQHQ